MIVNYGKKQGDKFLKNHFLIMENRSRQKETEQLTLHSPIEISDTYCNQYVHENHWNPVDVTLTAKCHIKTLLNYAIT